MTANVGLAHRYLGRLLRGRESEQGTIEYRATPLGSAVSCIFGRVAEDAGG